jgi:alpha-ketoglutarate-dependent taurine dioxygenase
LVRHGALLFRGFDVVSDLELERFARTMCADLLDDNGEHQRDNVNSSVYTPVFYPPEQQLLWHNENSFNYSWPSRIWFCCLEPAARGGQTPIADSREVFNQIDPRIRERFMKHGVRYERNYGTGPGLDWRTVFQTTNRQAVEDACRAARIHFEWWGDDQLRTSCTRPAAVRHPRTGEWSWFNQAQHWHVSCLDPATRAATEKLFREEEMPRNCYYGDGERIADGDMEAILDVYRRLEVSFDWQRGDVMLLDNILAAHGRKPFDGRRTLLVTMGGMLSYDDCQPAEREYAKSS